MNQLFDEAEVPVVKRQAINDKCDNFVEKLIRERFAEIKEPLVPVSQFFESLYKHAAEQGIPKAAVNASGVAAAVNLAIARTEGKEWG